MTNGMIGKYIEVHYPEVKVVEYSSSKKYSSNFWDRVLESTRVLAAALIQLDGYYQASIVGTERARKQ